MSNEAQAVINNVNSVSLAYESLQALATEWTAKQAELEAIVGQELTPVDPPTPFEWDEYINNIKEAWTEYMVNLETVYQALEQRYNQ